MNANLQFISLSVEAAPMKKVIHLALATYLKIKNGHEGVALGKFLAVFKTLGLLEKAVVATDPYESDLGQTSIFRSE